MVSSLGEMVTSRDVGSTASLVITIGTVVTTIGTVAVVSFLIKK